MIIEWINELDVFAPCSNLIILETISMRGFKLVCQTYWTSVAIGQDFHSPVLGIQMTQIVDFSHIIALTKSIGSKPGTMEQITSLPLS